MAYGLPIEGEGDSKCLALLNTVEEVVSRQLRGCKGGLSTKKKGCEGRKTPSLHLILLLFDDDRIRVLRLCFPPCVVYALSDLELTN